MEKLSVLIIADRGQNNLYHNFFLRGEESGICLPSKALEVVRNCKVDVAVLDCGFDVMRGFRLLGEIKRKHPDIPVIFITTEDSKDIELAVFKAGARKYFTKPLNILELKVAAERLLQIKRASREKRSPCVMTPGDDWAGIGAATVKPNCLIRAVLYIDGNLAKKITLEKLAEEACQSKYHFCRSFGRHFGTTPMRFVTLMRVERAKALLRGEDFTVSEAAAKVGFHDASTFIRQFKKVTGITPLSYKDSPR